MGILACLGPHASRCTIAVDITPTRHLEAAGRTAPVQIWSICSPYDARPVHVRDEVRLWLSAECEEDATLQLRHAFGRWAAAAFCVGCWPPSRSLQTFEVSGVGG